MIFLELLLTHPVVTYICSLIGTESRCKIMYSVPSKIIILSPPGKTEQRGRKIRKYGWGSSNRRSVRLKPRSNFGIDIAVKAHIFWEGYKILWNLQRRFVLYSNSQIYGGDFRKIFWPSQNIWILSDKMYLYQIFKLFC